ncbi:MAG: methionyl-tRNA formyltransferase [Trueperaceae bacterium]|nr:MAG: methionyl-tRNA formyltransferase [Trueperaceae bacterium]
MRLVFFGSPAFAVPSLLTLHKHHDVCLVVAQPDRPAGRGMRLTPPEVAQRAKELGLALEQPTRLKNPSFANALRELDPDVAVTVAYGKILPSSLLEIPRSGFLNVHASLLPKYRGAAPIQWALIEGEQTTGITIMKTEVGLDTGPICHTKTVPIRGEDTALTLFNTLSEVGARAIVEALALLVDGRLRFVPQDDSQASYAPMLKKEDGKIDWRKPAEVIFNRFRGVLAWPGSWFMFGEHRIKVHRMEIINESGAPGTISSVHQLGITVSAGEQALLLQEVQPAGKARMSAWDWANGYGVDKGRRLG